MNPRVWRMPDSLVLLLLLIVLAQLATYVLPAGEFEREGRQVVGGTYHAVEADPLPPLAFLTSIPAGLAAAQDIIFFVFIAGGVIGLVRATGAVDALIGAALRRLGSRPGLLIAGMVLLFALGSSTVGMAEEYVAFIPILVTLCLALRMDAVVAVGIVYVGAGVGYACAALNPFTVLIAQDIAGLPLTSGQAVRWLLLIVCAAVGVHHLLRYAGRLRGDPAASLVAGVDYSSGIRAAGGCRAHEPPSRGCPHLRHWNRCLRIRHRRPRLVPDGAVSRVSGDRVARRAGRPAESERGGARVPRSAHEDMTTTALTDRGLRGTCTGSAGRRAGNHDTNYPRADGAAIDGRLP